MFCSFFSLLSHELQNLPELKCFLSKCSMFSKLRKRISIHLCTFTKLFWAPLVQQNDTESYLYIIMKLAVMKKPSFSLSHRGFCYFTVPSKFLIAVHMWHTLPKFNRLWKIRFSITTDNSVIQSNISKGYGGSRGHNCKQKESWKTCINLVEYKITT